MSKKPSLHSAQKPTKVGRRGRYTEEFRREAVRLVAEEKYTFTAAAAAVNVCEKSLRDWHAKFTPQAAPCGEDAGLDELREEVKRLRKQLQRAEMEREILKKATAYFAKESL